MPHGGPLKKAVKVMKASVAIEERGNNTGRGIRKENIVRNGTFVILVEIATSTFVSLAHIANDGRDTLASQYL